MVGVSYTRWRFRNLTLDAGILHGQDSGGRNPGSTRLGTAKEPPSDEAQLPALCAVFGGVYT